VSINFAELERQLIFLAHEGNRLSLSRLEPSLDEQTRRAMTMGCYQEVTAAIEKAPRGVYLCSILGAASPVCDIR
jgi:hypothetical protein